MNSINPTNYIYEKVLTQFTLNSICVLSTTLSAHAHENSMGYASHIQLPPFSAVELFSTHTHLKTREIFPLTSTYKSQADLEPPIPVCGIPLNESDKPIHFHRYFNFNELLGRCVRMKLYIKILLQKILTASSLARDKYYFHKNRIHIISMELEDVSATAELIRIFNQKYRARRAKIHRNANKINISLRLSATKLSKASFS